MCTRRHSVTSRQKESKDVTSRRRKGRRRSIIIIRRRSIIIRRGCVRKFGAEKKLRKWKRKCEREVIKSKIPCSKQNNGVIIVTCCNAEQFNAEQCNATHVGWNESSHDDVSSELFNATSLCGVCNNFENQQCVLIFVYKISTSYFGRSEWYVYVCPCECVWLWLCVSVYPCGCLWVCLGVCVCVRERESTASNHYIRCTCLASRELCHPICRNWKMKRIWGIEKKKRPIGEARTGERAGQGKTGQDRREQGSAKGQRD